MVQKIGGRCEMYKVQKNKKFLMGLFSLLFVLSNFFGIFALTAIAYMGDTVQLLAVYDSQEDDVSWEALEVLNIVNRERMREGLHPLAMHFELVEGAQLRAEEIVFIQAHDRPDGRDWGTVFSEIGITNAGVHGENLAWGQTTPRAVMLGPIWNWMSSPGHRENILDPQYVYIGVGYHVEVLSRWRHHWTQLFMSGPRINGIRVYDENYTIAVGGTIEDTGAMVWMNTADGTGAFMPILTEMISGLDSSFSGIQVVTVYYQNFTATFEVNVASQIEGRFVTHIGAIEPQLYVVTVIDGAGWWAWEWR